ncbi:hypothetical protein OESDEN_11928 [Oesophagostomum dentatum]|uniref:Epoxide hydrolase n=1 Tax=Oesophagostomum dentatum TaxID=61180 RepID=A0A0B1SWJ6_OESDE|nr:hypothetical protein OESDEN_11928 [Oesophagostomum dentatum]
MKQYMSTPTAYASGMNDAFDKTPPEIASTMYNLTHFTVIEDMGHFAAFEMPQPLAEDILDFAKSLENPPVIKKAQK